MWEYSHGKMSSCFLSLETVETALVFSLGERHKYKYCLLALLRGNASPEVEEHMAVDPLSAFWMQRGHGRDCHTTECTLYQHHQIKVAGRCVYVCVFKIGFLCVPGYPGT